MMPTVSAAWNDQTVPLLKRLWKEGLSASQIAYRIPGATRSAVIGKVHRLKLPGRPRQVSYAAKVARQRPSAPISTAKMSPIEKRLVSLSFTRQVDSLPPEPPPQPRGDKPTLVQLKYGDCRWPYGDPRHPDFHYCGQPKDGDRPYCAAHAALAYELPTRMRRRAA